MVKSADSKIIIITLVHSPIGCPKPQKETVRALGLRRLNQTVKHKDTPALRGMITKVIHLVDIQS